MKHLINLIIILSLFAQACNKNKVAFDRESLLNHYGLPEDSLKRNAVIFLLDNMIDHTSELLTTTHKTVNDVSIISNAFLKADIDLAFELWNKYPWSEQVPFDIFVNFLLPYKVYGEEPSVWRSFFFQKYQDSINNILNCLDTDTLIRSANDIYYRILVDDVGQWFKYDPNPDYNTRYPGMNELMALKTGDCYAWSYLNVMILRSLGIPSTIDYVPMWGRKNGTHFSEVFWDHALKKFITASGREFQFPAKVFRYTFKMQNNWTDSIQPVIKRNPFLLHFLKHDHLLDVTHEHTKTATLDYEYETSSDFAYICVLNYGQWHPVFWGKVNNGKIRFENMGTEMLYRIAIPKKNSFEIVSPVFYFDENGDKTFFNPNMDEKINLHLSKLNTGSRSWVEKDKYYYLYYFDENSKRISFDVKKCEKDSLIIFHNIPSNTLYWIWDAEKKHRLERIFMYKDGEQVFY